MLLRRITQHVKDQNWFAVFLDFIIVVFGVFIGIQVANWNNERADKKLDELYTIRLHDEIELATQAVIRVQDETRQTLDLATQALEILTYGGEPNDLSEDQCYAIFASHIVRSGRVPIPTLSELLASGRASILANDRLRAALLELDQLRIATDNLRSHNFCERSGFIEKIPGPDTT